MKLGNRSQAALQNVASWIRAHTYPALATTVLLALLMPQQAVCQFVSPCCIQMALGLMHINGSLLNTIGGDLNKLNSIQSDILIVMLRRGPLVMGRFGPPG